MATIFKRGKSGPWVIQYFDARGRRRERSSRTTDHKTAVRIANELEARVALEREGIVDARQAGIVEQGRRPLSEHVAEYLEHCRLTGQADKHVYEKKRNLEAFVAESGAVRLSDLTVDLAERNLRLLKERKLRARTLNFRRSTLLALEGWLVKAGRLDAARLGVLPRFDEQRDRKRIRRALTPEDLSRLIAAARERGRAAWYMTAALAGMRRSELRRLTWGDVELDAVPPVLVVREGKARGRVDVVPLHPQLAEELRGIRPELVHPKARIFPRGVTHRTVREDMTRAGIVLKDEAGREVDLHALRTTLGTVLAQQAVAPQVARQLMRHADVRTTTQHYTALRVVDTAAALERVPWIGRADRAAQATGTAGAEAPEDPQQIPQQSAHDSARGDAKCCETENVEKPQPRVLPKTQDERDAIDSTTMRGDARGEMVGATGFEPANLLRPRQEAQDVTGDSVATCDGASAAPSRFPSSRVPESAPEPSLEDPDLRAIVAAWPTLGEAIKRAVLALIASATQEGEPRP